MGSTSNNFLILIMLKFTYKGHEIAYMPLAEATVPQIRAARSLAADRIGKDVYRIRTTRVV